MLSVDDSVGRLTEFLEKTGQLDRTIIVFMGDNGLLEGEHGMVDNEGLAPETDQMPIDEGIKTELPDQKIR